MASGFGATPLLKMTLAMEPSTVPAAWLAHSPFARTRPVIPECTRSWGRQHSAGEVSTAASQLSARCEVAEDHFVRDNERSNISTDDSPESVDMPVVAQGIMGGTRRIACAEDSDPDADACLSDWTPLSANSLPTALLPEGPATFGAPEPHAAGNSDGSLAEGRPKTSVAGDLDWRSVVASSLAHAPCVDALPPYVPLADEGSDSESEGGPRSVCTSDPCGSPRVGANLGPSGPCMPDWRTVVAASLAHVPCLGELPTYVPLGGPEDEDSGSECSSQGSSPTNAALAGAEATAKGDNFPWSAGEMRPDGIASIAQPPFLDQQPPFLPLLGEDEDRDTALGVSLAEWRATVSDSLAHVPCLRELPPFVPGEPARDDDSDEDDDYVSLADWCCVVSGSLAHAPRLNELPPYTPANDSEGETDDDAGPESDGIASAGAWELHVDPVVSSDLYIPTVNMIERRQLIAHSVARAPCFAILPVCSPADEDSDSEDSDEDDGSTDDDDDHDDDYDVRDQWSTNERSTAIRVTAGQTAAGKTAPPHPSTQPAAAGKAC